jgi:hypothetical protein
MESLAFLYLSMKILSIAVDEQLVILVGKSTFLTSHSSRWKTLDSSSLP